MVTESGKPKACGMIFKYFEISIIEFFKQKALGFLYYYKPTFNYHEIKKLINYHMRWSLLHTLAGKHSIKIHKIIKKYGKSPKIILITNEKKKKVLTEFLTPNDINHKSRGFVIPSDFTCFKNNSIKLSFLKTFFFNQCVIVNCKNSDIRTYYVRSLRCIKHNYISKFIISKLQELKKCVKIKSVLNKKKFSICKEHYKQ